VRSKNHGRKKYRRRTRGVQERGKGSTGKGGVDYRKKEVEYRKGR
jgi:hypothetical protein